MLLQRHRIDDGRRWLHPSSAVRCALTTSFSLTIVACSEVIQPPESVLPVRVKRPVAGHVRDSDGPVKNAVVRLQGSSSSVITSTDGSFILTLPTTADSCVITAWAPAYYVGWSLAGRSADSVLIELKRHYSTDNPEYTWFSHEGAAGSLSCSHCMPSYDEWIADAHSQSAVNVRFLTMYNGTDVYGNKSPPTRYGYNRDYGAFPLPPDPTKPY